MRRSTSGMPSRVGLSWPSVCSGLRSHDRAGRPSITMRKQPHAPSVAQPFLAETTPHSSRSTSSRCIPGSYEAVVGFPFSVNEMVCIPEDRVYVTPLDGLRHGGVPLTFPSAVSTPPSVRGYMKEPWKTDKWFISAWNYVTEVTKN